MRKIIIGASVVVALIAGGLIYLFSSLDGIVKSLIEQTGTQVTGVKVSVGSVTLSLTEGKANIAGLTVANPPGFSAEPAIRFGDIAVVMDTNALGTSPIIIKDVIISAPVIGVELAEGGSNLDVLRRAVTRDDSPRAAEKPAPAAADGARSASADGAEKKAADDKKAVIDHLAIVQGQVKLAAGGLPGAAADIRLGDIVLTGIGRDHGGATPGEIGRVVLDALLSGALKASTSTDALKGEVMDKVKGLSGQAGEVVKGLFGK